MTAHRPRVSAIVLLAPDEPDALPALDALGGSDLPRHDCEIIAVAYGVPEATIAAASHHAHVIVRLGDRWQHGPSYARNRGAALARGRTLVFLDGDVAVRSDTLRHADEMLATDPTLGALIGVVEPAAGEADLVTRYVSAVREWGYLRCLGDTEHFSTRFGAIRSDVFFAAGQLDEWHESAPDADGALLGVQVRALGNRIEMRSDLTAIGRRHARFGDAIAAFGLQRWPAPWLTGALAATPATATGRFRRAEHHVAVATLAATLLLTVGLVADWSISLQVGALAATWGFLASVPLFMHVLMSDGVLVALFALPVRAAQAIAQGAEFVADATWHGIVGEQRPNASVQAFAEVGARVWPPVPARPRLAPIRRPRR